MSKRNCIKLFLLRLCTQIFRHRFKVKTFVGKSGRRPAFRAKDLFKKNSAPKDRLTVSGSLFENYIHLFFPNLFADEFHITVLNILCIRQCIIAVNRKFTEFSRSHSEFFLKYIAKIVFVGEFQHI